MKLGRNRPPAPPKHRFAKYLNLASLPPPPPALDLTLQAMPALDQMYGNDTLGDCVEAASAHLVGVLTAMATGSPFIASDGQIVSGYSAISEYVPGDPSTDNGADEQTAFGVWKAQGMVDGTKLIGFAGVDATNQRECMTVCALNENLFIGFEMPNEYVSPFPSASGFVWDVAGPPNPANGHAVLVVGYDAQGVKISTWGMIGTLTWGALEKYCVTAAGGELYTLLSPDLVARGKNASPGGVNWTDMLEDFAAEGGSLT